jgi:hypothetical protein
MLGAVLFAVATTCGFSLEVPQGWTVAENPRARIMDPHLGDKPAKCAVGLRPPGWRREMRVDRFALRDYPIRITFWNLNFRKAARQSFFIRGSDLPTDERPSAVRSLAPWEWGIFERQSIAPAHMFTTECCQGVRGVSWSHESARDGSTLSVIWEGAVVNDRAGHSVVVENDQEERFRSVFTRVLRSIRFAPR